MILRFFSLYLTNTNYIVNILSVYHVPDINAIISLNPSIWSYYYLLEKLNIRKVMDMTPEPKLV